MKQNITPFIQTQKLKKLIMRMIWVIYLNQFILQLKISSERFGLDY